MAIIVDRESEYKGERTIRNAIENFFSNDVVVYNNREVNGREYDICLLVKDVGIFIVEVKGWLADKIKVHGIDDIEIEGYEERQTSPKKQAKSYCIQYFTKLKRKFNVSPLVVDLVAYPFISKEQYYSLHLNIISEEQFTLFSEDLKDHTALKSKFQAAFDAKKTIPHAELTSELLCRIRRDEEPEFENTSEEGIDPEYSLLSIIPYSINNDKAKTIVESYARGTKQFVFVNEKESFNCILNELNAFYRRDNIEPGSVLSIGYKKGIDTSKEINTYSSFNFNMYMIPELGKHISSEIVIEEGEIGPHLEDLDWIAKNSSFNLQQYCVEHASTEKNTLVEAGAGTGKTHSMVSRVAFLCNKRKGNITSLEDELAMVTFTNDAATNMKIRLKQMFVNYYILTGKEFYLGFVESVDRSNISTIHKFALQLLRGAPFYTGLGTNFRISSDEFSRGKIYDVYLSEFLRKKEEENNNFINEIPVPIYDLKKKIIGIADRLLQKSINIQDIKTDEMGIPIDDVLPYFNEIISEVVFPAEIDYLESINDRNAVDLKECIILLNKVLAYAADNIRTLKLRYLFVDEFQDTDDIQIEVFKKIQKTILSDCRLFVVGDLKQSIYRFRGARLSAFEQLQNYKRFEWEVFHLTINYRTDYRLLDKFDDIFMRMGGNGYLPYNQTNDRLTGVKMFETEEPGLLQCISCSAKDEVAFYDSLFDSVRKQYENLKRISSEKKATGEKLKKEERTIALLVRSNWQVKTIINEAQIRKIPIEVKSGGDLFQLESTQDLYKLILAIENSKNPLYLVNFIESNYTDLDLNYHKYRGMSEEEKLNSLTEILNKFFELRMGKTWTKVLEEMCALPVLYALKQIYDALKPWENYSAGVSGQRYYMENYDFLLERIVKFSRIDALTLNQIGRYLEINILTKQQVLSRTPDYDDDGVHIICTTVHKSKGLEYGTVILPYTYEDIGSIRKVKLEANYSESKLSYSVLFENKLKVKNSNYDADAEKLEQISEESRILYVALTRAIRNCIWVLNKDSKAPISWQRLMEG